MSADNGTPETTLRLPDGTEYAGRLQYDDDGNPRVETATCGACGFQWNDALITAVTPVPSGRCPNEYAHPDPPPREWNFAVVDEERSSGWSNHTYCLQVAFTGYGDTPQAAFHQAKADGEIPEALEPDTLTVWPSDAERVFELGEDGELVDPSLGPTSQSPTGSESPRGS